MIPVTLTLDFLTPPQVDRFMPLPLASIMVMVLYHWADALLHDDHIILHTPVMKVLKLYMSFTAAEARCEVVSPYYTTRQVAPHATSADQLNLGSTKWAVNAAVRQAIL